MIRSSNIKIRFPNSLLTKSVCAPFEGLAVKTGIRSYLEKRNGPTLSVFFFFSAEPFLCDSISFLWKNPKEAFLGGFCVQPSSLSDFSQRKYVFIFTFPKGLAWTRGLRGPSKTPCQGEPQGLNVCVREESTLPVDLRPQFEQPLPLSMAPGWAHTVVWKEGTMAVRERGTF